MFFINTPHLKTSLKISNQNFAINNLSHTFALRLWFLAEKAKRESGKNPEQLPLL